MCGSKGEQTVEKKERGSPPGAVSEREAEREGAEEDRGAGRRRRRRKRRRGQLFSFSTPPARLDNRGQLKQKEKVMNLALPLFNYRALIVTADQFQGRSRRTKSASCCPAWPEKKEKTKTKHGWLVFHSVTIRTRANWAGSDRLLIPFSVKRQHKSSL